MKYFLIKHFSRSLSLSTNFSCTMQPDTAWYTWAYWFRVRESARRAPSIVLHIECSGRKLPRVSSSLYHFAHTAPHIYIFFYFRFHFRTRTRRLFLRLLVAVTQKPRVRLDDLSLVISIIMYYHRSHREFVCPLRRRC